MATDELGSARAPRLRRGIGIATKVLVLAASAAVLLATGAAWSTEAWYDSKIPQVDALDVDSPDIREAPVQHGAENFLIIGSDSRMGANSTGQEAVTGARSDVVMLAHVPADRSRAVVVSFPRDLEITVPRCERWNPRDYRYSGELHSATGPVKLNAAYAYGGPRCLIKVIQRISGVRINHFVGTEFRGFREMVDAVGGVSMGFSAPVVDRYQGTVVARPGVARFDGERALRLVRSRVVRGDPTGDYGRIKRQQQFISALFDKTMSREVLLRPAKLTGFVNAFAGSTFGDNIGVDQLLTLAQSMRGLGSDKVIFRTVPTTGSANERGNEVLDKTAADRLFDAVIHNGPLPKVERRAGS